MTSSVYDTKQMEKNKTALYALRNALLANEKVNQVEFKKKYGISVHFFRALRNLKFITDTGFEMKWIHKNDLSSSTDEVTTSSVTNILTEMRDISNAYSESKKKAQKKEKKVTQAVKGTEPLTYTKIPHQLTFISQELEKEKQVKGYMRPEFVNFLQGIHKNLEKLNSFRELALEELI